MIRLPLSAAARRIAYLLFLSLPGLASRGQGDPSFQEVPDTLSCRFGVIGIQPLALAPDTVGIAKIALESPAARAGLRPGDRLIAIPPYRIRTPDDLSRCVQSFAPGTSIPLLVQRQGQVMELTCEVTDLRHLYFLMDEEGANPDSAEGPRHRHWSSAVSPLEAAALELVRHQAVDQELEDLVAAFAREGARYGGDGRLQDIHFVLHHPLKATQLASDLAAEFEPSLSLDSLLCRIAVHLDLAPVPIPQIESPEIRALLDPEHPTLSQHLLVPFLAAGFQVDRAFALLSDEEKETLREGIPPLLARFARSHYLDEGDTSETAAHLRTLRLAKRIDLASLFAAANALTPLARPDSLKALRRLIQRIEGRIAGDSLSSAFGGTFLYARHTPIGWFLIGDAGPNCYGEDAALIVDLGGDDLYANHCASPWGKSATSQWPVGLIIDYGGNDRYLGRGIGTIGAAIGGVGLLLDLGGDDLYQGTALTQGAAFGGIGLLWDQAGNDLYLASEVAQGAAFFGAGLLLDGRGRDQYLAAQISQAFGGSQGMGLLIDGKGNDRYLADFQVPSSYSAPGAYQGWSQGVGCGFRGFAAGGIGLLLDGAGDDQYQAGDFAQGTGYFFGLGILVDKTGNDAYRGSHYAQGTGAHQAIGVLLDLEGNDQYSTHATASQGAAWDAAIGMLEDRKGNDRYQGQELVQGAAAMNGLGFLIDWQGRDRYRAYLGQGYSGSLAFWGGRNAPNLGFLIDTGGQSDIYNRVGRRDQTILSSPRIGLFLDR